MPASAAQSALRARLARVLCRAGYATLAAVALSGAFLAGPARARADDWTAALVLLHVGLGALLAPICLAVIGGRCWVFGVGCSVFGAGQADRSDRSDQSDQAELTMPPLRGEPSAADRMLRRAVSPAAKSLLTAGGGGLAAAFFTGAALVATAARGGTPAGTLLDAHVGAGFAAVGIAGVYLSLPVLRQQARRAAGQRDRGRLSLDSLTLIGERLTPGTCALVVGLLLVALLASSAAAPSTEAPGARFLPDEYYANLTATNARQAMNPLFPAGTRGVIEPGAEVHASAYCGSTGCHPHAYRQWLGSPHQQAAVDPAYRQAATLFAAQRGPLARRWCEGCHAPAAMVDGALGVRCSVFGPNPKAEHPTPNPPSLRGVPEYRTPNTAVQPEGVNCLTCHAAARVIELSGNGRFELRVPSDYPFAADPDPRRRWLHDFLLRLRPGPHRLAFMRPAAGAPGSWLERSELCSSCHRMSYNLPQNDYKFLRTDDEYGTWQAGPDSGESVHDFFPPRPARQCQDCHDPHRGGVRCSVLGVGNGRSRPNTERRTPNAAAMIVDLLALRRSPRTPGAPEELIAPLDQQRPIVRPGEMVTVDVVVRNRGVGHEFPGGIGSRETWLEFAVLDGMGRQLFHSGGTGPHGEIDPGAHTYGLIALDRHGRRLVRGDLWNMVAPLYYRSILPGQPDTDRRTIQPGESDVVRYRMRVAVGAVGPLRLQAHLWSRRSGMGGEGPGGELIAADSVTLPLAARPAAEVTVCTYKTHRRGLGPSEPAQAGLPSTDRHLGGGLSGPTLSGRFYDYGVGLLLQGDLPRAMRAMRQVQALSPREVQGYLGLGRVYLTEGDLLAARTQFEQAKQLAPFDPRATAFLAATERRMGEYGIALALLRPLLRAYPRDKLLWFDAGMCHYLSGRYEEASQAFTKMLDIDPDDLAAHYNLMRSLRRLRRVAEARREAVIYQTLREDDNARRIGLAYLRTHPLADRETRTVHEHSLAPHGRDEGKEGMRDE